MTWDRALSVAGVPADSVWRLPGSVFYPPEIREVPATIPSPFAHALKYFEQTLAIPNAIPLVEITKGSSQANDQGQGAKGEKGKGKGKGKKLFAKLKDAAKEKEVEAETQGADP